MSDVTTIARRLMEGAASAFAFLALMLCLSHLPEVIQGPWGYGKAVPSRIVVLLANFVPTTWFCYATAPLVFWIVFRRNIDTPASPLRLVALVVVCFVGPAAFILNDLLTLHGTYAVERPAASMFTVAINLILLVLVALPVVKDLWRQPKLSERQHETSEPAKGVPNKRPE